MTFLALLCLCFAVLFIWKENQKQFVLAVILKGLASLCFVLLGLKAYQGGSMPKLIVIGLICGCIADILLNLRWVFEKKGQTIFLAGILVFLAGHIMYLAAVLPLAGGWLPCLLIGTALTALLMKWIFARIAAKMVLKIFGIIYIGTIVMLNCTAIRNLILDPNTFTAVFALGAFLFLISDIVLILNTFGGKPQFKMRAANLGLYYAGQLLIAISLLFL